MNAHAFQMVQMVPVAKITVVNPRVRNKRVFKEIVDNIAHLGLKRPITVTKHEARRISI
jgi:ParB family transcriptional regulator, chromosome partitioning protein